MRRFLWPAGAITLLAVMMGGCAPMSERVAEEREYHRVEFQNRFILHRTECFERGGRMEVLADAAKLNRDGVPEHRVRYFCVLRRS